MQLDSLRPALSDWEYHSRKSSSTYPSLVGGFAVSREPTCLWLCYVRMAWSVVKRTLSVPERCLICVEWAFTSFTRRVARQTFVKFHSMQYVSETQSTAVVASLRRSATVCACVTTRRVLMQVPNAGPTHKCNAWCVPSSLYAALRGVQTNSFMYLSQVRLPAELKHIIKRWKRKQKWYP